MQIESLATLLTGRHCTKPIVSHIHLRFRSPPLIVRPLRLSRRVWRQDVLWLLVLQMHIALKVTAHLALSGLFLGLLRCRLPLVGEVQLARRSVFHHDSALTALHEHAGADTSLALD